MVEIEEYYIGIIKVKKNRMKIFEWGKEIRVKLSNPNHG